MNDETESNPKQLEKQHFIEEVALVFEDLGQPRMAGRILGWLLICNPPHQSADDLAEALQASKGSISAMTRLLIQLDMVERIGFPGERRDYFRIKPGLWSNLMRRRFEQISSLQRMAAHGLDLLADEPPEVRQRLQEINDMYAFFAEEFPLMFQRWLQRKVQGS